MVVASNPWRRNRSIAAARMRARVSSLFAFAFIGSPVEHPASTSGPRCGWGERPLQTRTSNLSRKTECVRKCLVQSQTVWVAEQSDSTYVPTSEDRQHVVGSRRIVLAIGSQQAQDAVALGGIRRNLQGQ